MRTFLAGMWSRRGLNGATFLLAVVAVAVAMTGPLYAHSSAEHLLDSRMAERLPATLGLTVTAPAMAPGSLPSGSPDEFEPPSPETMLDSLSEQIGDSSVSRFWQDPRLWLEDRGGTFGRSGLEFVTPVYWREGMCSLAQVQGRCPEAPGEALMSAEMAGTLDLSAGDTFALDFTERWLVRNADGIVEKSRQVTREFAIVGTYRVPDPTSPAWFQPARFQGDGTLRPPTDPDVTPTAPALLVGQASMTSQTFVGGADRPIDPGQVDLETMDDTEAAFQAFSAKFITLENASAFAEVDLAGLFDEVESEQELLSRVTLAAAVPLVVLALLLLYVLVSAAADVRRPEVALAKLRGLTPRRVLRFAVSEPFLVVLAAAPVAVLVASVGARLLARTWLAPGVPVVLGPLPVGAAVVVTLTALLTAGSAVLATVREPLAASLASASRRPSGSRVTLVLRSAVVMLAIAAVVQVWSSRGSDSTTVLELLAPLFVGLAVAVAGIGVLALLARWWVGGTARRGGVATYLASRRLLRRRDMVRLMVPLLLSVSVTSFAVSAWQTADDWRVSKAKASVGAARTYLAETDPSRLMHLTHQVDPEGRYLAAAVVETARAEETGRQVLVDLPRFAETAAWDEQWSELSAARVEEMLRAGAAESEPLTFTGRFLSVDLRDVHLEMSLHPPAELWVRYRRGDTGSQSAAKLGDITNGSSQVRGFVSGCAEECVIQQLYLTGSSASVTDAHGELTIAQVTVDGQPVDWGLSDAGAWRPARDFPLSLVDPPVTLQASARGLTVDVRLGSDAGSQGADPTASGIARISHGDLGDVPAVVVTSETEVEATPAPVSSRGLTYPGRVVSGTSLLGVRTPMRKVAEVGALPGVGGEGALSDLGAALREYGAPANAVAGTQLWVAEGTPASVVDEIRDAGVVLSGERTVSGELERLRTDAFSLGWRIFLLVAALTLLLSILGILAAAVIQSRWRTYEVAALRVLGVRRRDLVRASVLEYLAILGCSVLLGVVSAAIALTVVLPSIDIGDVGEFDPAVDYAIRWPLVGAVSGVVFVAVMVIAVVLSRRTARLGRPSTLREGEQG